MKAGHGARGHQGVLSAHAVAGNADAVGAHVVASCQVGYRGADVGQHSIIGELLHPSQHRLQVRQLGWSLAAVEVEAEGQQTFVGEASGQIDEVLVKAADVGNQHERR